MAFARKAMLSSYLMGFEADPFKGRFMRVIVVVCRPEIFLCLAQEPLGLGGLRVGARECRRDAEIVFSRVVVKVLLVSFTLLFVLLSTLVHLVKEELVGVCKVRLEGGTSGKRIAWIEIELGRVKVTRPWKSELQALQLGLDMLSYDCGEGFVSDVFVRMPLQQKALDGLLALRFRELPRLFQSVTHLLHHLLRRDGFFVWLFEGFVLSLLRSCLLLVELSLVVPWLEVLLLALEGPGVVAGVFFGFKLPLFAKVVRAMGTSSASCHEIPVLRFLTESLLLLCGIGKKVVFGECIRGRPSRRAEPVRPFSHGTPWRCWLSLFWFKHRRSAVKGLSVFSLFRFLCSCSRTVRLTDRDPWSEALNSVELVEVGCGGNAWRSLLTYVDPVPLGQLSLSKLVRFGHLPRLVKVLFHDLFDNDCIDDGWHSGFVIVQFKSNVLSRLELFEVLLQQVVIFRWDKRSRAG